MRSVHVCSLNIYIDLLISIKDEIVYLDSDDPTTSTDIRSYTNRSNDPDERTISATDNTNHVSTTSQLFDSTENCQDASSINLEEGWTLCDIERQQLREMFPTCNEVVLADASRSATLDLAVDHIMNHSTTDAGMYILYLNFVL